MHRNVAEAEARVEPATAAAATFPTPVTTPLVTTSKELKGTDRLEDVPRHIFLFFWLLDSYL